ncbi:MAG: hypothetical protein AB8G05_00895 [Oligoflexales bacterium]
MTTYHFIVPTILIFTCTIALSTEQSPKRRRQRQNSSSINSMDEFFALSPRSSKKTLDDQKHSPRSVLNSNKKDLSSSFKMLGFGKPEHKLSSDDQGEDRDSLPLSSPRDVLKEKIMSHMDKLNGSVNKIINLEDYEGKFDLQDLQSRNERLSSELNQSSIEEALESMSILRKMLEDGTIHNSSELREIVTTTIEQLDELQEVIYEWRNE